MSKTLKIDPDQILMQAVSFTLEDLAANRDGYMTKAQRSRLHGERQLWIAFGIIGIALDVVLTTYVANSGLWSESIEQRCWVVMGLLLFGLFLVMTWVKQHKIQADLYKGTVDGFEYWLKPWWYMGDRGKFRYYVAIRNERIPINHITYQFLSAHDFRYYVYCAANSKKLLSFEPLLDDD